MPTEPSHIFMRHPVDDGRSITLHRNDMGMYCGTQRRRRWTDDGPRLNEQGVAIAGGHAALVGDFTSNGADPLRATCPICASMYKTHGRIATRRDLPEED